MEMALAMAMSAVSILCYQCNRKPKLKKEIVLSSSSNTQSEEITLKNEKERKTQQYINVMASSFSAELLKQQKVRRLSGVTVTLVHERCSNKRFTWDHSMPLIEQS